jgi:hypothetical protein
VTSVFLGFGEITERQTGQLPKVVAGSFLPADNPKAVQQHRTPRTQASRPAFLEVVNAPWCGGW